jgi:hypothetical protein
MAIRNRSALFNVDVSLLQGYLRELDLAIMAYGRAYTDDELAELIGFAKALGLLNRICRNKGRKLTGEFLSAQSENATLALVVWRALTMRRTLERRSGALVVGLRRRD